MIRTARRKKIKANFLDWPFALIGLTVAAPVIGIAAALIKLDSKGPVFFRQTRIGKGFRRFQLIKLRTMTPNRLTVQITARNDVRITRVGKWLRFTKIDELPELFNVLKGDMALVGPRPEVPQYVDPEDPQWMEALSIKPGITDPVTLNLRNEEDLLARAGAEREKFYRDVLAPFKLKGYCEYVKEKNWRHDFGILFASVMAVIVPSMAPSPSLREIEMANRRTR